MGWAIALSLAPGSLLFALFFLLPLLVLLATSFTEWNVVSLRFTGFQNYLRLIHDGVFWKAVGNTAFYAAAADVVQVPLAVFVAMILAQKTPGWRVSRAVLFVPVVISGAAYALIFASFYNARYGLLNRVLAAFGGSGRDWLFDVHTALPAIAATYAFSIGFYMILVMSEIGAIPPELLEAASLDGATLFRRLWFITLPLLRHVIGTCILLCLLATLAFFDIVYILTVGGPADATVSLTVYAFRAYTNNQWGYANTIGVFVVAVGFLLVVVVRRVFHIGEREL